MASATKYAPEMTYRKADVVPRRRDLKVPIFTIDAPEAAARAVAEVIGDFAYEHFVVLYVDVRNKVMGYDVSTEMSPIEIAVTSQSIIRNALLMAAIGVVTAHQHPSGDPTPSTHDEALWERLREQAKIMQLAVLDNLVVGDGRYYSEVENGIGAFKKNPGGRVVYPKLTGPEAIRLTSNPRRR